MCFNKNLFPYVFLSQTKSEVFHFNKIIMFCLIGNLHEVLIILFYFILFYVAPFGSYFYGYGTVFGGGDKAVGGEVLNPCEGQG